jgi:hypothetical protein
MLDMEGGVLTATPCGGYYPTFSSLVEPLLIYFTILAAYAASSGDILATLTIANGCNTYIGHLSALNRQFQWNVVLQYHKSYFLSRHREMARGDYSGWLHSDVLLMNEHLYSHPRTQNHPGSSRTGGSASSLAKQPAAAQVCLPSTNYPAPCRHALMAIFTSVRSVRHQIMGPCNVASQHRILAEQFLIWLTLAKTILWFPFQLWLYYRLLLLFIPYFPILSSSLLFFCYLLFTQILLLAVTCWFNSLHLLME